MRKSNSHRKLALSAETLLVLTERELSLRRRGRDVHVHRADSQRPHAAVPDWPQLRMTSGRVGKLWTSEILGSDCTRHA